MVNGLSNTLSDLLGLDFVAEASWTIGDHRRPLSERLGAAVKLAGHVVLTAAGGPVFKLAGKAIGFAARALNLSDDVGRVANKLDDVAQFGDDTAKGLSPKSRVDVYRTADTASDSGAYAPGGPTSVKQLRMELGRAGMKTNQYKIVRATAEEVAERANTRPRGLRVDDL